MAKLDLTLSPLARDPARAGLREGPHQASSGATLAEKAEPGRQADDTRPLVVDLDGTLVASDLLVETALWQIRNRPGAFLGALTQLRRGKAALKQMLARDAGIDVALLPYRPEVLAVVQAAQKQGRPVYLASAANASLVEAIADHLGLFTGWFASDGTTNLSGSRKAARLVEAFGARGFDYIGNDALDLAVWQQAATALTVDAPAPVLRRLRQAGGQIRTVANRQADWRAWLRMLRVHQYAKNVLVFVPMFAAHLLTGDAAVRALAAFVAFSFAASAAYILNDLMDLQDDRGHRSKRNRPLASGEMPLRYGLIACPFLLIAAIALAGAVSPPFLAVLTGYFVLTVAYSYYLKRKMLVDVIALAGLYTIRIIGGAAAVSVAVSNWLLAFSMMMFMALALIKRYVEVAARQDTNLPELTSRNYKASDLNTIAALAAAAGFNAVTIFAVYISSDTVHQLYSRPELLWFVGPLLMYWIARALMMAARRQMHDDPLVFAMADRRSLLTMGAIALLIVVAI